MAKRLDGEGSIVWHNTLNTYMIRVSVDGKRLTKYRKNRQDAVKVLKEMQVKYGLVQYDGNISLEDWYEEWLFEIKASSLRPKSISSYLTVLNKHIRPYPIAKMAISSVTKTDVTRYFNQLARDGRSIQTIKKIKMRLTTCFNNADDFIVKNPVPNATLPKAKDNSRTYTQDGLVSLLDEEGAYNVFTPQEQTKLVQRLLEGEDWVIDFLLLFLLGTGLRLGEVLALNYNFDIKGDNVLVRKAVQRVPIFVDRKVDRYEKQIVDTKTSSSVRAVPLPKILVKGVKERVKQIKAKTNDPYFADQGLLFPNELGDYLHDGRVLRRLKVLNGELGLSNINVHGLRHSYATRLLEVGEPIQVISKLLGHSSVELTQGIYSHVMDDLKTQTVSALDNIL